MNEIFLCLALNTKQTGQVIKYINKHSVSYGLVFQFIPMAVLYGVFFYMGVAALTGMQVSLEANRGILVTKTCEKTSTQCFFT